MSTPTTKEKLHDCPTCGRQNFTAAGLRQHRCKPSGALTVIPAGQLAKDAPAVPLHNLFHRNAMLSAAQSACWLVFAGVELKRQKREVGHGKWEAWVEENCEYGDRTARKYMDLAEGVKDKLLKAAAKRNPDSDLNAGEVLALMQKPAGELLDGEQLTLLKAVHHLTDGATVSELYQDFGITKTMKDRGGARTKTNAVKLTPDEQMAIVLAAMREDFTGAMMSLDRLVLRGVWKAPSVSDAELDAAVAVAEKFAREAKAWLKTPKKARVALKLHDHAEAAESAEAAD